MQRQNAPHRHAPGLSRRELLQAGLAAGATLSAWSLSGAPSLWGGEPGQPKRGGILRVRGWDPPHFDPHLTIAVFTHSTLSFVYSRLVRHKVGADVPPGTFILEPDLAERWEELDDTTYVFHLRQGVKWHNKPPVNGCELVANDATLTAMLKAQRRTKDLEARKQLIFDIQRYVAAQQYYVYLNSSTITGSWQPYVKNYAPTQSFDYGIRAAALWLDR